MYYIIHSECIQDLRRLLRFRSSNFHSQGKFVWWQSNFSLIMAQKLDVTGFDAFIQKYEELKSTNKTIIGMFSGGKDENTGKSWCPDCVVAQPVVDEALQKASSDTIYIYCSVGGRDFWKDKSNVFRTDSRLRLKSVPTLIKFGTPQRLEEAQCASKDLVEMLFEES